MSEFQELWDWIWKRTERGVRKVQERSELEYVFNLMKSFPCQSYLEVGTAEGNSLHVLANAVCEGGRISYIDLCETHTKSHREEILEKLKGKYDLGWHAGDSTYYDSPYHLANRLRDDQVRFDCVMIDGGHDFATVLSDAINYGPLAKRYIFFHDIQLPEVKKAVEWFQARWNLGVYKTFVNSESFGYGIIEVFQSRNLQ